MKKLLVVEDRDALRDLVASLVQGLGFEPIQASNGRMALKIFQECDDINLVLSDLEMPEMNGVQFYEAIHGELADRGGRFVACSGSGDQAPEVMRIMELQVPFLRKPFGFRELREMFPRN